MLAACMCTHRRMRARHSKYFAGQVSKNVLVGRAELVHVGPVLRRPRETHVGSRPEAADGVAALQQLEVRLHAVLHANVGEKGENGVGGAFVRVRACTHCALKGAVHKHTCVCSCVRACPGVCCV